MAEEVKIAVCPECKAETECQADEKTVKCSQCGAEVTIASDSETTDEKADRLIGKLKSKEEYLENKKKWNHDTTKMGVFQFGAVFAGVMLTFASSLRDDTTHFMLMMTAGLFFVFFGIITVLAAPAVYGVKRPVAPEKKKNTFLSVLLMYIVFIFITATALFSSAVASTFIFIGE